MRLVDLILKAKTEHRLQKTAFLHPELEIIAERDKREIWSSGTALNKSSKQLGFTNWIEIGMATGKLRLARLIGNIVLFRQEPFSFSKEGMDDDRWTETVKP